jgi:CubicO group peptidase (beta-lactamase class C family)
LKPSVKSLVRQESHLPYLNGQPIHRASFSFRDLKTKDAITGNTQFPIETMAKTFTASAVGAFIAEGKWK